MAEVRITIALREQIFRIFKQHSQELFDRFKSLETQPQRGKAVGHVGSIVIKELKEGKYRFYFITDGHILKFGSREEIAQLLIKFVRMSFARLRKCMLLLYCCTLKGLFKMFI